MFDVSKLGKILIIAGILVIVMVVAVTGTVLAQNGNGPRDCTGNNSECAGNDGICDGTGRYSECPRNEGVCDGTGPYRLQKGKCPMNNP